MSLPSGISTCVVTFGRATSYLGNDATITGVLSADRTVVHAASGVRVGSGDDVVPNEAGFLSFPVPHVDQAGFIDGSGNAITGWLYILTGSIRFPSGKVEAFRKTFQVLVGQAEVDLDLLPDGPILPTFTAPSAVVTSVNGETGAVTVAGASDDAVAALVTDDDSDTRAALSATFVPRDEVGVDLSAMTVFGHSYCQGDQNTRLGGWLGSGSVTAGSTTISSPSTFNGAAVVGQRITGAGIPEGAIVTAVSGGNPTTLSVPASATRSGTALSAGPVRDIRWPGRVASALRIPQRNLGRNGSRAWLMGTGQGGFATALQEIATGYPSAPYLAVQQVVAIMHGINDLADYDNLARLKHALRLMVSRSRASAIFEDTSSTVAFGGGTWSDGAGEPYNSGGTSKISPSNPAASSITVTIPADFPAGAVASFVFALAGDDQAYRTDGVYRFARGGVTLVDLDTRGIMGSTSNVMAACQRVPGLAANDVVTITFPTPPAGNVFFDCWMIEAPASPLVMLLKQPLLNTAGYNLFSGGAAAPITDARVNAMNDALDALAAEFADGLVKTVDLSALDKAAAKFATDAVHPNEQGHADIAAAVLATIRATSGINGGQLVAPVLAY